MAGQTELAIGGTAEVSAPVTEQVTAPSSEVTSDTQITPSENVGVTDGNATAPEVVSNEQTVEPRTENVPITLYENRVQEARRLQSERDRAEAYTRKLLESVMPYVQVDNMGNVTGPRQQEVKPDMTKVYDELSMRAAAGDTDAIKQMNMLVKDEAKREALSEFRSIQSQEAVKTQITNEIKTEFPDLFNEQGAPNQDNPIWNEANNIVNQERKGWYDMNNPYHVKSVLEIARSRVILNAYPELKKAIKKEVMTDIKKTGALSTATVTASQTQEPEKLSLSPEQLEVLKKSGVESPDDLRRISNMVKSVKNRSFVIS